MTLDLDSGAAVLAKPLRIRAQDFTILRPDRELIQVEMDIGQRSAAGSERAMLELLVRRAAPPAEPLFSQPGAAARGQVCARLLFAGATGKRQDQTERYRRAPRPRASHPATPTIQDWCHSRCPPLTPRRFCHSQLALETASMRP